MPISNLIRDISMTDTKNPQATHNGTKDDDKITGTAGVDDTVIMSRSGINIYGDSMDVIKLNGDIGDTFTMKDLTPKGLMHGYLEIRVPKDAVHASVVWKATDEKGHVHLLGGGFVENASKLIAKFSDGTEVTLTPAEIAKKPEGKITIVDRQPR